MPFTIGSNAPAQASQEGGVTLSHFLRSAADTAQTTRQRAYGMTGSRVRKLLRMLRFAWISVLAAAAVVSLAGCEGQGVVSGGVCLTNRECPETEICVAGKCEAISGSTARCTGDGDCAIGEFCDPATGACGTLEIIDCTGDAECPAHQKCNTFTGVCIDGSRGCMDDTACAAIGYHCDTTTQQCKACLDTSHCSDGATCIAGSCDDGSDPPQCTEDNDCNPPNEVCQTNRCVPGCARPGSPVVCDAASTCNAATGRCESGPMGCSSDAMCGAPSRICESTQCIPGCAEIGGLQCTGGNVCNPGTGRCEAQSTCNMDPDCAPPATVCENTQCVPGCGVQGGLTCGAGEVCDNNTGRCVPLQGPCTGDGACNPPNTVCETGQCVPGCGQVGGIQCNGSMVCNAMDGRCEQGQMPMCTMDAQCSPPSTVCDQNTGTCIPGCTVSGCGANETCNPANGHCETSMMPPMGSGSLNTTCASNADCTSTVCFDIGGSIGPRCIQACGASTDCPSGFTCYPFDGAKMCVSAQLFNGASFGTPAGGGCANSGQCRSNYCHQSGQCVETCTDSSQCPGGACAWTEVIQNRYIAACDGPNGNVPDGGSCSDDAECASGACLGSQCGALCSSSTACSQGETCVLANYSQCTLELFGSCLQYAPNFVMACAPQPHGNDPIGAACAGFQNCRSALCHTGIGQCTDVCGKDSDCPGTHRCKTLEYAQLGDGTTVYINVCLPASY